MLTPEGLALVLDLLRNSFDQEAFLLRVFADGATQTGVDAPMDQGFPAIEDGQIVFQATFTGGMANFRWARHAVVVGEKVIDSFDEDLGEKVEGSEWVLRPKMSLVAQESNGD